MSLRLLSPLRLLVLGGSCALFMLGACVVGFESGPRDAAGGDASPDTDAPANADGGDASNVIETEGGTLFAFADDRSWEAHPLAGKFAGAAFDGRYVYFVPRGHFTLWRFDTTMGFNEAAAWQSVELPHSGPTTEGHAGAAFAGGAIYLAPALGTSDALRYPTSAPFVSASWESAKLADVLPTGETTKTAQFLGVVPFRGRIYFIPTGKQQTVLEYDPAQTFTQSSAWRTSTLPTPDTLSFAGSVATDAGLYFVPLGGPFAIFDGADFTSTASFTSGSAVTGLYVGAVTDGKDLFFVPGQSPVTAVSFPVGGDLESKALRPSFALESFASCANDCFAGGIFDGRYVYFVPRGGARFVRYDTQSPTGFTDPLSWTAYRPDGGGPTAFFGGAFDGRYVYFVPDGAGTVLRLHAREPAAQPNSYSGSFL